MQMDLTEEFGDVKEDFEDVEHYSYILNIAPEMLTHIFTFLELPDLLSVALVNSYFYSIVNDEFVWSHLNTLDFSLHNGQNIQENHPGPGVIPEKIFKYTDRTPNLRVLNCSGCTNLDNGAFQRIFESCKNLLELNLNYCYNVTQSIFENLPYYCPRLEKFSLVSNSHIQDSVLPKILRNCTNLTELNLAHCRKVRLEFHPQDEMEEEEEEEAGQVVCLNVRTLDISHNYFVQVPSICLVFPNLTVLRLSGCIITEEDFEALVRMYVNLTDLDVSQARHLVNISNVRSISLRRLNLSDCQNLTSLELDLPQLEEFYCENSSKLSVLRLNSDVLSHLEFPGLTKLRQFQLLCPSLKSLEFYYCESLLGSSVKQLLSTCANLKRLTIDNCSSLTTDQLSEIAAHFQLQEMNIAKNSGSHFNLSSRTLQSLEVRECENLTHLKIVCLELKRLVLTKLPKFNDHSLVEVLESRNNRNLVAFQHLQVLDCEDCPKITQEVLGVLLQNCPLLSVIRCKASAWITSFETSSQVLEVLDFSSCPNLKTLSLSCPRLKKLDISLCPSLTRSVVHSSNLKGLNVEGCQVIEHLVLSSPVLEKLLLKDLSKLVSFSIQCPKLQRLLITKCPCFTEQILLTILQTTPELRLLSLSGCKNIKSLKLKSTWLESLILSELRFLDEVDLHCPSLQLFRAFWCGRLKDTTVQSIIGGSPSIDCIELYGCPAIRKLSVGSLKLKSFTLKKCLNITELQLQTGSLNYLEISGCSSLKFASIRCTRILGLVMPHHPKLEKLYFMEFDHIDERILTRLASICRKSLTNLSLFHCKKVDVKAIQSAIHQFYFLDTLLLEACETLNGQPCASDAILTDLATKLMKPSIVLLE